MKKLIVLAPIALLAGCNSIGGPGVSNYYECDRGTRLKVDNLGQVAILVSVNGETPMALNQVQTGSGVEYSNATHNFRGKGKEAMWTVGRMMPEKCTQVVVPR